MIVVDFETRSLADLARVGGRGYVRDPSTELLLACAVDTSQDPAPVWCWSGWLTAGVSIRRWELGPDELRELGYPPDAVRWMPVEADLPADLAKLVKRRGSVLAAQNADAFDALVWEALGYPAPGRWVDTMPLFARRGLPRGLENAGQAGLGVGKDDLGHKLMKATSMPQRRGIMRGQFIPPDAARLSRIAHYCARDALLTAALAHDEQVLEPDPDDGVLAVHRLVNSRGVPVDLDAARRMRAEMARQAEKAVAVARKATRGKVTAEVLSSPLQLRAWLKTRGVSLPDAQRDTIQAALKGKHGDVDEQVSAALEARLATSNITESKLDAILSRTCPDGRLRDWAVYYGAHTGRFSSRGVQTQNFKKVAAEIPEDVYDEPSQAPRVAEEHHLTVMDVFGSMLRGLFVAQEEDEGLGVIDLASIEARVTAWCADDWDDLQVYVRGEDPYIKLAAEAIYHVPKEEIGKKDPRRAAGKVGVLACGYQGGPSAITRMATKMGIDLAAAGVTPEQVVEGWRNLHPLVAGRPRGTWTTPEGKVVITRTGGLWRDTKEAVESVAKGHAREATGCKATWRREGEHLVCVLPSGRRLVYRHVGYEKVPDRWGGESWSICFTNNRGHRTATYGGKLVENVVQAVCRDLLTGAMVELERVGIPVLLHVHDEVVFGCKRAKDFDRAKEIITRVPEWMPGMVIGAEGDMGKRYTK